MKTNVDVTSLEAAERAETIREAGIRDPEDREPEQRDGPVIEVVEE